MRAAHLCLLLGTSIAYAGCVVDTRDDTQVGGADAGPTQGSSQTSGPSTATSTTTTTGVSDETNSGSSSSDDGANDDAPLLDVAPEDTEGIENAEVFGHSGRTLYRLDPDTLDVEEVGDFEGCDDGSIIDIALDEDSNMFGVSFESLYEIDRITAECTLIAQGDYPTSLSFVPEGTVDADREALVGFVNDRYVRIDTEDGTVSDIATLADGLASSGDVVSVKDGSTYLTVRGPDCDAVDCIIEFNPSNGIVLENFGQLPYDEVFGLAFWGGKAYGFARNGQVFEVEFVGSTAVTTPIDVPNAPAGLEFFGAGSTTSAPPAAG